MTILVTGTIDFDPAKRDDAIAAVTTVHGGHPRGGGLRGLRLLAATSTDPGRFHVTEQWASQEAMDIHMATPAPRRR